MDIPVLTSLATATAAGTAEQDSLTFVVRKPGADKAAIEAGHREGDRRPADRHPQGPGRVRGRAAQADRPAALHDLRTAGPGRGHRRARHHQHPRAVGDRADPRDRAAAGGRTQPSAAADHAAAGVGRHRPARCRARCRARPGRRLGAAALARRRRHRRAGDPGRAAGGLRGAGRGGRSARRALARAAGLAAGRAAGRSPRSRRRRAAPRHPSTTLPRPARSGQRRAVS